MFRIEVTQEGHATKTYKFDQARLRVGRGPDCELQLQAPGISSFHAQIMERDGDCVIVDENSTNGTYLHGARIRHPTTVQPHDAIYICNFCLRIEYRQSEQLKAPDAPPPSPPPPFGEVPPPPPVDAPIPTVPEEQNPKSAEPPAPVPQPSAPPASSNVAQAAEFRSTSHSKRLATATATIAPGSEDDKGESSRGGAQKISVAAASSSHEAKHSTSLPIQMRSWPVPGAPRAAVEADEAVLADVFARLAQPFLEQGCLPPSDECARAEFYALAQAQLSINLSPQSTQMECGAQRIVRSLCAIGPLAEILSGPLLKEPNCELVAQPYHPIRSFGADSPNPTGKEHEPGFVHPWALNFTITRLLGRPLEADEIVREHRLSNGLQLSAVGSDLCDPGPMLVLRSPPRVAGDWQGYSKAHKLLPAAEHLLRGAVHTRCPLIICEREQGPDSLWSALQSIAAQHSTLVHIAWSSQAPRIKGNTQFCAKQNPLLQAQLYDQAQAMPLAPIIAVDQPSSTLLDFLDAPTPASSTLWLRLPFAQLPKDSTWLRRSLPAPQGKQESPNAVGLVVEMQAQREGQTEKSSIARILEFDAGNESQTMPRPLFERREGELVYVGDTPRIYPQMAQEGLELAPPV